MREIPDIQLGSIKIHKKVIIEITEAAVNPVDGVSLVTADLLSRLSETVGFKYHPGIAVTIDKNHQVIVEVKVILRYGLNVPETARHIQDVVRTALERTVEIDLKDVNVNIYGIARGQT